MSETPARTATAGPPSFNAGVARGLGIAGAAGVVLALTATITGPVSLLVWFATGLVFTGRVYPLAALPLLVGPVLTVTGVMSAIHVFLGRGQPVQTHAAPAGSVAARFPERLPMRLRGAALRAVQAEDHYLRVHTDRGSDLILMRPPGSVRRTGSGRRS